MKNLTVAVRPTKHKKIGWCVFLNHEAFAVGTRAYCDEIAQWLILRYLRHGPESMPFYKQP